MRTERRTGDGLKYSTVREPGARTVQTTTMTFWRRTPSHAPRRTQIATFAFQFTGDRGTTALNGTGGRPAIRRTVGRRRRRGDGRLCATQSSHRSGFRCFADRSIRRRGCQAGSQRGEHMATSRRADFDDDLSHCHRLTHSNYHALGVGASLFHDLL